MPLKTGPTENICKTEEEILLGTKQLNLTRTKMFFSNNQSRLYNFQVPQLFILKHFQGNIISQTRSIVKETYLSINTNESVLRNIEEEDRNAVFHKT